MRDWIFYIFTSTAIVSILAAVFTAGQIRGLMIAKKIMDESHKKLSKRSKGENNA